MHQDFTPSTLLSLLNELGVKSNHKLHSRAFLRNLPDKSNSDDSLGMKIGGHSKIILVPSVGARLLISQHLWFQHCRILRLLWGLEEGVRIGQIQMPQN